jgi:DNA transformation protein
LIVGATGGIAPVSTESEFQNYLAELLAPLGVIRFGRMFGAVGIIGARGMSGLIIDETLYFKVTAASGSVHEAAGMGQISYDRTGRQEIGLPYFEVPDVILDEPDRFIQWARPVFAAAVPTRRLGLGRRRRTGRKS